MDTTRRGFMKLLGLGTAGMAAAPSLFSSDAMAFVGTADHYVFETGVRLTDEGKAHFLGIADDVWAHGHGQRVSHIMMRKPRLGFPARRERGWSPSGETVAYQAACPILPGHDPHVEFFLAADTLRNKINADVQEFSRELRSQSLVMVTIVDMPILALPNQDEGFYLETQIRQFATRKDDIMNIGGTLSCRGEIPMGVPNTIEFKHLMHMQRELRAMGLLEWDRQAVVEASRRAQRNEAVLR